MMGEIGGFVPRQIGSSAARGGSTPPIDLSSLNDWSIRPAIRTESDRLGVDRDRAIPRLAGSGKTRRPVARPLGYFSDSFLRELENRRA
jgi:hypothetical protein